ncbi:MAG: DUF5696 domain-containing protein [Clostridiaceae bacterium]
MGKKRKVIILALSLALLLNIAQRAPKAAINQFNTFNNRGITMEKENTPIEQADIPESFEKIGENDFLELYLNEETLGIKVRNKKTNYYFSSSLDSTEDTMNQVWQGLADSAITLEYVDRSGKEEMASIINENTEIDINKEDEGFKAAIEFKTQGFSLELQVVLDGQGVRAEILSSSIKEEKTGFRIRSIYLYPFFGATTGQDISGYMFIPDGSGALIRLDERNILASEPYRKRIYNNDFGINGASKETMGMQPLEGIQYPVYGMVHNVYGNGYLAVINEGAEYGEINGYRAGITTPYNWITSKFIVRDSYFQPTNRKGEGIQMLQEESNAFDISLTYHFLEEEGASYAGMAKKYQELLINEGVLKKQTEVEASIPLKLEVLLSENKKGFLWRRLVEMSTTDDIRAFTDEFIQEGINNIQVVARGWTKGGAGGSSLNHRSFEKKAGRAQDWDSLRKHLEDNSIELYMYTDYIKLFEGIKGTSIARDSAQTVSEQIIRKSREGFNYAAPGTSQEFFKEDQRFFEEEGIDRIAVDSLGYSLYSSYKKDESISRAEVKEDYLNILKESKTNNALYKPNSYLWEVSDNFYSIPMSSSNYSLITDNVPFLQIVLKGYMDYFISSMNFSGGSKETLLQMIDYGVYPSYYLTREDSVELLDTRSSWLYTSKFSSWEEKIKEQYEYINGALSHVTGEAIVDRRVLQDGVVLVTYSNDVKIAINYNDTTYEALGLSVEGNDYRVIGGR